RALTLMARIDRGEARDEAVVQGWRAGALTARRGPDWVCDKCGHAHADWVPICAAGGSFVTLAWREAENAAPAVANGADMLPLIVGGPASASDTPADDLSADDSARRADRKSTRLNSSHVKISYAVFCLKKKKWRATASAIAAPSSSNLCCSSSFYCFFFSRLSSDGNRSSKCILKGSNPEKKSQRLYKV